jgi:hypothetical protein
LVHRIACKDCLVLVDPTTAGPDTRPGS